MWLNILTGHETGPFCLAAAGQHADGAPKKLASVFERRPQTSAGELANSHCGPVGGPVHLRQVQERSHLVELSENQMGKYVVLRSMLLIS